MIRFSSLAPVLLLAHAGCSVGQPPPSVTHVRNGFCEIRIGMPASEIPVRREQFTVSPEGISETRSRVRLCEGSIRAELAYDERDRVDWIALSESSICLDGVCMGQRYADVRRRNPELSLFASREEGGVFYFISPDRTTTYGFDTEDIPAPCFEDMQSCHAQWDNVRVSGIMISRPLPLTAREQDP